jgi:hypothetical protein
MSSLRHRGTEATLLTLIKEAVDALDNVFSLIFIVVFVVALVVAQFAVLSGGLFIGDTEKHVSHRVAVTNVGMQECLLILLSSTLDRGERQLLLKLIYVSIGYDQRLVIRLRVSQLRRVGGRECIYLPTLN